MSKRFVEDINQTPTVDKSKQLDEAKAAVKGIIPKLPWIGAIVGVVCISVFFYMMGKESANKIAEQAVVDPPKQIVVQNKLETASNTVTEDVIYVEYLDKVDGSKVIPNQNQKDNVYTVGDYSVSFSQVLTETSYAGVYKLGDTFVYLGTVENVNSLEDAFLADVQAKQSYPAEVTPTVREFANAVANYSLQNLDSYIWQKQVDFAGTSGYETVGVFGAYCVGFIDTLEFKSEEAQDILAQVSAQSVSTAYLLLDTPVDTFYNYGPFQLIAPAGITPQDFGVYTVFDLGESLSNNCLFVTTMPSEDVETKLSARISTILVANGMDVDGTLAPTIDTNATWLYRTARYVEYSRSGSRVACYVFDNKVTNEATVFMVAEKDNKFPYLLRYLNTLALEIR